MTARAPLVFGADGLIQQLQAGDVLGGATGSSFPGSPGTGDRFWRSDRATEYYYDGTRWLSTQILFVPFPNTDFLLPRTATTGTMSRVVNPWAGLYDIYALDAVFHNFITATSTWTLSSTIHSSGATFRAATWPNCSPTL
jgi:hypothetical protein